MSTIDQCPSTKGKIEINDERPEAVSDAAGRPVGVGGGRRYWRSTEDFADDPSFREFVHREFPAGASELAFSDGGAGGEDAKGETRRGFLKLMGASLALAGAATIPGCRRPDHQILPYGAVEPEFVVPGKPLYYATSYPLPGGGAEGLLVETHSGRPTKIEGNPLHPINRGKSSAFAQSSILETYDPDRLKFPRYENPTRGRLDATWDDFRFWWAERAESHEANGGASLAIVCQKKSSPVLKSMEARVKARFPKAAWVWWDAVDAKRSQIEGTRAAFGSPRRVLHDLEGIGCVLSLSSDFLEEGPNHLPEARAFAKTRLVEHAGDEMSRLYVAEPHPTGTGSLADHRWRMTPSEVTAFSVAVCRAVLAGSGSMSAVANAAAATPLNEDLLGKADAVAQDLLLHASARSGSSVIIAGDDQPAAVHALVAAANETLGAPVRYLPMDEADASDPFEALGTVADRLRSGGVDTLVTVGVNPVYDAPAGMDFGGAAANAKAHIAWGVLPTETTAVATWELNGASYLESWGDTRAADGTISPVQPMIKPLYDPAMSETEFLAYLAGEQEPDGYRVLRESWATALDMDETGKAFDKTFRRALHDGVVDGTAATPARRSVRAREVAALVGTLAEPGGEGLEIVFKTGRLADGRYANVGWLQELPQAGTSVVWQNPVVLSPATAKELRLLPAGGVELMYTKGQIPQGKLAELTINGVTVTVPVWICPGMADGVAHVQLGYGREVCGSVGDGVGFNAYPLRTAEMRSVGARGTLDRAGGTEDVVSTQNHWSLEGRTSIVRALDKKWWDAHAASDRYDAKDKVYKTERRADALNLAEQMGEMSHTPDNVSIYKNPFNESKTDADPGSRYAEGPQWGMTIDLSSCTGCGVCTVACQSENNIPIVGKTEVAKGREMQWIRVDRYFSGDDLNSPDEMIHQPVACVHCENAPCEVVCPVTATVHGPEGTNNMAYNRCIGTRYCANNCPYKVRRFNFFDYAQTKYNGSFLGSETLFGEEGIDQNDFNKNFIPPRLREKVDEITAMRQNPDVTVRGRGVMEKCSYCIQRVNAARQEVKVKGIWNAGQDNSKFGDYEAPIPDGFFQVACQQACPTDSIVFGDILDPESRVTETRSSERSYMLLGYLNTRPRTSHMLRVRNPNPLLGGLDDDHDPLDHGSGHGGEHHDEHGDDHGDDHGGDHGDEHTFVDPGKRFMDDGYRASLRVLS